MTTTTSPAEAVLELSARWRRPDEPDLAAEYEQLFVGPGRVPCPPYESLWRDDVPQRLQGSLLGPCVPDLQACYAGLRLDLSAGANELPDHIAVELEALAVAVAEPGYEAIAGALLHDHLAKWVPAFCGAVAEHADSDHYRQLAVDTTTHILELDELTQSPDQ